MSEDTDAAFDSALFVHAVSVLEVGAVVGCAIARNFLARVADLRAVAQVDRVQRLRDSLTQRLQRLSDLKVRQIPA